MLRHYRGQRHSRKTERIEDEETWEEGTCQKRGVISICSDDHNNARRGGSAKRRWIRTGLGGR